MKKWPKGWQAFIVGAALAFTVLFISLAVQSQRHGWPFASHHSKPAPTVSAPASKPVSRVPVEVPDAQAAALDLRFANVSPETLTEQIRAVATVVPDESRLSHVHTRVAGWIERLYVSNTGEAVRAGQPLADIFSQELLASQTEYLAARRSDGPPSAVVESGRSRLKVLGMSDADIRAIEKSGIPMRVVTLHAPRSGVMLHRGVSVGTAVDPSTEIMIVGDLSRVWVQAEVPEYGVTRIKLGMSAQLEFPASGRTAFPATVEFVDPVLSERTRTLRVRFSVANADGVLRPGLYGTASFKAMPRKTLSVPRDAVVDTGESQHVFVVTAQGKYEPRTVRLGARMTDRVEIIDGLAEGEKVLASGTFLIDSESRLRASGGTAHSGHVPAPDGKPAIKTPSGESHLEHGG